MIKIKQKIKGSILRAQLRYKIDHLEQNTLFLGSQYGGFTVCNDVLDSTSIVYSFGIGEDITFDLELIERFGCDVFAFDPTPRSIRWLESQRLPSKFHYFEIGLADRNGIMEFAEPANPNFVSYTTVLKNGGEDRVHLKVKNLQTIMNELGHTHLDLLKMDIEGCEYGVIKDICKYNIPVYQIVLEFHHRFKDIGIKMTNDALLQLREKGYNLFYISTLGDEMSFIQAQR